MRLLRRLKLLLQRRILRGRACIPQDQQQKGSHHHQAKSPRPGKPNQAELCHQVSTPLGEEKNPPSFHPQSSTLSFLGHTFLSFILTFQFAGLPLRSIQQQQQQQQEAPSTNYHHRAVLPRSLIYTLATTSFLWIYKTTTTLRHTHNY